jgi:branched-chain amino acid transport system ATP-binding protein
LAPDDSGALVLRGVTAGYGRSSVLHGIDIEVRPGQRVAVLGPNGAGKSTLLATVSGVLRARLGQIRFRGRDLVGLKPKQILALGIVQVPQNHSLFPEMTVRENVEIGAFTLRDKALTARRLGEIEELFPIVRDRAREKAGSLSGGQRRLIEFARSLMLDPSLIVLDEPSMGLDPKTRRAVFDTVRLMNHQGRTILLVEQNARAGLKLSTQGVVLENGVVRLAGTGREVLEHPDIGALYLGARTTAA